MNNVRRVVTGLDEQGRSVVISDSAVSPLTARAVPGYAWHRLWSFDASPVVPNDGRPSHAPAHFPPPEGVRFIVFTVPPRATPSAGGVDPEAAQELEEKFPGRAAHMESDQTGLHTTATIDLIYILSGEVSLELDGGKEVHLRAGDTVVQNGVRHAWRNYSDRPCSLVACILGARRREG
jgi:mannose-6-phosphate isomerase-like protein (cupin superfamily)